MGKDVVLCAKKEYSGETPVARATKETGQR